MSNADKMCKYCREENQEIAGKVVRTDEWKNTAGYNPERNKHCFKENVRPESFEQLDLFILKGKADKEAGLMIDTINGARYININYCPMCGRKLGEKKAEESE